MNKKIKELEPIDIKQISAGLEKIKKKLKEINGIDYNVGK